MEKYAEDRGFTGRIIRHNTWAIQGIFESPYTHLLIGENIALVIDPGQHRRSIREYIESITDLPLIVANTHGHFDHTAANGQFRDCEIYMHPYAVNDCKRVFPHLNTGDYCTDYDPIHIEKGHVFDLGSRRVEAIAIGCHSPGSYAYLDRDYRILFTGDEVESGQVLINDVRNLGYASVELYLENLKKLKKRIGEFDMICPAHNGTPMDNCYIDIFIENAERIMSGIEGKKDISSPTYLHGRADDPRAADAARLRVTETFRRSEWKGTSLVYDINKIFIKK